MCTFLSVLIKRKCFSVRLNVYFSVCLMVIEKRLNGWRLGVKTFKYFVNNMGTFSKQELWFYFFWVSIVVSRLVRDFSMCTTERTRVFDHKCLFRLSRLTLLWYVCIWGRQPFSMPLSLIGVILSPATVDYKQSFLWYFFSHLRIFKVFTCSGIKQFKGKIFRV